MKQCYLHLNQISKNELKEIYYFFEHLYRGFLNLFKF